MKKGVPISPGIAVARAFRIDEACARQSHGLMQADDIDVEIARFEEACNSVAQELDTLISRVSKEVGEDAAAIFRSHRVLLRDPGLANKVKREIQVHGVDAPTALDRALEEYTSLFARISDEYLRERMADIRDVISRIINRLTLDESAQKLAGQEPIVLVAAEFMPSQAVMFDRLPVAGIVTEAGGSTGHAAILARSLGIPAVSGLRGLLKEVHTGDMIIVDGREGGVLINPGPEVESAYRKLQREYVDLRHRLIENRDQDAITSDGVRIELLANVNNVVDAAAAVGAGANGVGLFRTEYVYLSHTSVPTEEEQVAAYRAVIEASPNHSVVIRTLDLGGDKQVPYLGAQREANPFMGWRSVRMSSEFPEFFQTQMRAILKAGVHGKISMLFPMVSTVEEVIHLKLLVENARQSLELEKAEHAQKVPFGVLIEVPAAAICIDQILEEVDFISVGSNDLIQYLMAADRDNPKVAHLCEPCHPAVFRILNSIITACVKKNKPVTLCGEMAGRPLFLLPLLGMGLTRVSMSPNFVPTVKEMVRTVTIPAARRVAKHVVNMQTVDEVREYLSAKVRKMCPNVAKLDTM
ncbi:MAG: phosphoenolpyruvate--protein phosphotransferase [Planctomycetes bacterium]|nr:phosphoenolpyruvate--protein phosphotransferase [Planctomycetota bacterium]